MTARIARAVMAVATCLMSEHRRAWTAAMRAEFAVAAEEGAALPFAFGCLATAARELLTREEGRFTLTSYALALGLMLPMAAVQIGCAVFGLPYLYPDRAGLTGALLQGREHEALVRGIYQAAVPSLAMLLVLLGLGHVRIAWAMLDRDWASVRRLGAFALAAAATLIGFMGVLFLDGRQALTQAGVLAIELAVVTLVARWHAQLHPPAPAKAPARPG